MNHILKNENMLRKSGLLVLMMAIPVFALGQHKTESRPSAPAHASAPAHSAPSHSAPQSHTSTPSHSTAGHTAPAGHTATTGHTAPNAHTTGAGHTAPAGHTTAAGHTGPAGHTAATGRAGAAAHTGPAGHEGAAGRTAASRPGNHTPPGRNVSLKGGGTASVRPNGRIRSIDRGGMHIEHGVRGGRTVVSERNGARVVTRGRGGYVQRAYVTRGGRTFVSRTYVSGGVTHVGVYRSYSYGGRAYYGYYPGYWYNPGFYAWGYQPWGAPVYWGIGAWGWGGSPWYGYYGGYFAPYPYYASPAFWLTDYLLASSLQSAYAARAEENADAMAGDAQASSGGGGGDAAPAPAANSNAVTLTPEVKQAIAEEVKVQLAAQQAQAASQSGGSNAQAPTQASGQVPPALDPAQRTFVVDTGVTVVANGQECALTAGDVITRLTDTPDSDQTVNASVSASKKSDCASGQTVAVKVDDLQEMYNHFQEQLTSGMGELAKKQGTGGIPKAPDTSTTASDVPPPPPDNNAAKTLQEQQAAADQTEAQVKQETAGSTGGGSQ